MNPHRQVRESDLKYLPDTAIVEQIRADGTRLFPHTEQLPAIWNAAWREFAEELPNHFLKTDHRATDERKHMLWRMVHAFCNVKNMYRDDGVMLMPYTRRDLVARIAVVQKITLPRPDGNLYTFRKWGEGGYYPDLRTKNGLFAFTGHCFERFRQRFTDRDQIPLSSFLGLVLHQTGLLMRVNGRVESVVYDFKNQSLMALPIELREGLLTFVTCLSVNEISSLEVLPEHKGLLFRHEDIHEEKLVTSLPVSVMGGIYRDWWVAKNQPDKGYFTTLERSARDFTWHRAVRMFMKTDYVKWTPGSWFCFQANCHTAGIQIRPPEFGPPPTMLDPAPDSMA